MRKNATVFLTVTFIALCWVMMVEGLAFAQEKFPSKQMTFVIPWAAGGGQDLAARAMQPVIEKLTGVPVLVVNKPGGGATIGFGEVMRSDPDGYTLCHISPSISIVKYTIKDTPVDYVKFEPIIFSAYAPQIVVARKEAPWNTLKELLDYAKANPGKLRVANTGYGAIHHMGAIGIELSAKVKVTHIPYKGTGAAIPELLGGHVDVLITSLSDILHLIKGGVLKAIGVADSARNKYIPEVQTFVELGVNHKVLSYHAWIGPKGIPKERVQILYDLFVKTLNTDEIKAFYDRQGATISVKDPTEFGKFLAEEDKRWREMITIGGIKPE
ncbi:MAG: tripartite tricarboxylate transporter substrate binding protein [Thermodesulfobacteriota bacterium]|nr:tripartite tricarboxylate transporter substrate binding protein [Thermodesulfobacteriota bacterium]